ncbi:tRNA-uridine aminocarboxypropyltransferase [Sulfuricurvum sp.]|uniref:tRNA-uridine aminocarboxypropyltransferase n=1 Tax=Sulfuricurvum sp. TaxID=2025608 RepID=UPI002629A426|nr:tRNA-uridine aminocarboxypropyltransferase [Sulfuricurvum sp.]MDD2266631.1 DTW domain-containing protein [Sulfuricurvum sp.]MDD2784546.1 DTW domain-containing protein [Sulfuricurvum sp.]
MDKIISNNILVARSKCYKCYRPMSSCMCSYVNPLATNAKFIILMHPKEFKKTKNGTGHLTHLSLPNSELLINVDFTEDTFVNSLINDSQNLCYVLYPGKESINLNTQKIALNGKQLVVFIIDSTWPCSVKMLRLSKNLQSLPKLSFTHTKNSQFKIKEQPNPFCLSTIESVLTVIELLHDHGIEQIESESFEHFLAPFNSMVNYQIECASRLKSEQVRFIRREK